jgi:hypothetical protein
VNGRNLKRREIESPLNIFELKLPIDMKHKTTALQRAKELELHEFLSRPHDYIMGFLERRKAANKAVEDGRGLPADLQRENTEKAAFYNQMLNAVVQAFKGDNIRLLETLEMPHPAGTVNP